MERSFFSACILLVLVIDPLGNIPFFAVVLRDFDPPARLKIILRECIIAFAVLAAFLCYGRALLQLLQLSERSLGIAGGVVLFLIALRMIFHSPGGIFGELPEGPPVLVPLAIPSIAGPSALATVLLLSARAPGRVGEWLLALTLAVAFSAVILSLGDRLIRLFGERGLSALERLMGLILTAIAVQMFLDGLEDFVRRL